MDDPIFYTKRARDGTRTRDPHLGKVVLHQLSHSRKSQPARLFNKSQPTNDVLTNNRYSIGTIALCQE